MTIDKDMNRDEIQAWLRETDPARLEELWQRADEVRRENVGDEVHLRGLIEFSSFCTRLCGYCGLRAANKIPERYRMTADEIIESARRSHAYGYGTVVMQSGEDYGITADWMADVIRRIKAETPLAITLSLGERSYDELKLWREAGADRYLLRFETSNRELFEKIHPARPGQVSDRIAILKQLEELGYETGSGVMIGIPGETYDDLANDIATFREINLDMIGVGPYIAHPDTPLGKMHDELLAPEGEQVPATEDMTYKVLALTRIVRPMSNIPSTTALATLNLEEGRELGLSRGANVVMPNVTPVKYRALYEIYPSKACINETDEQCHACMRNRILSINRIPGEGRGDSRNHFPDLAFRTASNEETTPRETGKTLNLIK